MRGTIVKGISGFYYVKCENEIIECKARGRFRFDGLTPMVGDKVEIEVKNGKGRLEKIYERSNELIRPVVSNVTQIFIVTTIINPELNLDLLNSYLVLCEYYNIKTVICINKMDLIKDNQEKSLEEMLLSCNYDFLYMEAKEGVLCDSLLGMLKDNVSVFCGPSGVGKSTILNNIIGSNHMETGELSNKIKRGKNTTRHSELIETYGGYVVDTPGFSSVDISFIESTSLKDYFPEFSKYRGECKYNSCMHFKEPNCKIKALVEENIISKQRYSFYIRTLEQLIERRNNKW